MRRILKHINRKTIKQMLIYPRAFKKTILYLSLLSLISGTLSVATAYATKYLVDRAVDTPENSLISILIAIGAIFLADIIITSTFEYFKLLYRTKEYNRIQKNVIERCLKKEWLAISHFQTGDLLTRVNNDTQRIIDFWLNSFPDVLGLSIRFVLAFALLWRFDPLLAVVSFVIAPIMLIISYPISHQLKVAQRDMIEAESALQSIVAETLQNLTLIKVFNHSKQSIHSITQKQNVLYGTTKKRASIMLLSQGILILGYTTGQFLGLSFGAFRLSRGLITFGTFSALIQLIAQIQGPLTELVRTIPRFIVSKASSERLTAFNLLDEEPDAHENLESKPITAFEKICINNVSFEYNSEQEIIHHLNLEIINGDKIAIIGPSGSGKTTFSRLLLSFLKPKSGEINVITGAGEIIANSPHTRNLFAYVPQDNILFSGTIRDNLLLANQNATHEEIMHVLKQTCSDRFIFELPNGLETHVGERGVGLSEGQIQRLCIARALLYKKPILILDEATSALDMATETEIIENLKSYGEELTLLAITHRPSIRSICTKELILD